MAVLLIDIFICCHPQKTYRIAEYINECVAKQDGRRF